MRIGAHISAAGGVFKAFERAHDIGCETMMIFTKSNRQWKAKVFSLAGGRENVTGGFERSEISRNLKSGEQTNFRVVVSSRRSGTTNPLSRSFSLKAVGGDGIGFDTARSQVTLRSRQSTVTTGKPGKLDDVFGSHP